MALMDQIVADLKSAMLAKEEVKVETLRSLKAAIKNFEIDKQKDAAEADVIDILQKEVKKRRDAIQMYQDGGRDDLVSKEQAQIDCMSGYLPEQMSEEELSAVIDEVISASGATGKADLGKVMGQLMPKIKGKADGGLASKLVNQKLS